MAQIKAFLLNPDYKITTTIPRCVSKASDALSKSKVPGTRTLGYQKEMAVERAERDGEMQTSALYEQLEKGVVSPTITVRCIPLDVFFELKFQSSARLLVLLEPSRLPLSTASM